MTGELRWALIVISALVIGGLLVHGLWSVRKRTDSDSKISEKSVATPTKEEPAAEPELGDLNISAVEDNNATVSKPNDGSEDISESDNSQVEPQDAGEQAALEPQEFIILHVQMPEGLTMAGSRLLPTVLSLGFKYSEEGFFNRHQEPSGNGPVLFRLVNMYNPGTFDIDNMEQFGTEGVSLFMTLPCEGDNLAAFNMLHSAAKKLADEFGATVLDSERAPLTVNRVRTYVEKVREFAA